MTRSLVSLVLLLLMAGAGSLAAPRPGAFTLAILRRDGILMPFATYDGKHWENPWPSPGQVSTMPIAAADIPKGWWHDKHPITDWTLLPIGPKGAAALTTRTLRVKGVNYFRAGCVQGAGLTTDYKPSILPPPPAVHPYPKDALAYSGDVQIDPIEIVDPKEPVVKELTEALPGEITPRETSIVDRFSTGGRWSHSYNRRQRDETPVTLEALYRVPQGLKGRNLYYYEAVKRYFLPKDDPKATCDLVTFASGWFSLADPGQLGLLDPHVVVTSCDFDRVRFMLPLGTMTIDGEHLWIVQWSSPSWETYMVGQPSKMASVSVQPLIEIDGGNCPKE
jgi:hypothetical protein